MHNNTLQATCDPLPILAFAKTGIASNAPERDRKATRGIKVVRWVAILAVIVMTACAGTVPSVAPEFPLFASPVTEVAVAVGVVDSIMENPIDRRAATVVRVRVLESVFGEAAGSLEFAPRVGLVGCGGMWEAGVGGTDSHRWFAVQDTVLVVVSSPQVRGYPKEIGFVRWLRGYPQADCQVFAQGDSVDYSGLAELCRHNPVATTRECYGALRRTWTADARTLGDLTRTLADFYANRRREYWAHWR